MGNAVLYAEQLPFLVGLSQLKTYFWLAWDLIVPPKMPLSKFFYLEFQKHFQQVFILA